MNTAPVSYTISGVRSISVHWSTGLIENDRTTCERQKTQEKGRRLQTDTSSDVLPMRGRFDEDSEHVFTFKNETLVMSNVQSNRKPYKYNKLTRCKS